MMTRSVFNRWLGLPIAGALAAVWPLNTAAQRVGQMVDQTIRNPAGQGIQQAAVAHVTNAIILVAFWLGVIGLVALVGVGAYGIVEARGNEDRLDQAKRRVRLGAISLGVLAALGLLGWFFLYR